MHYKSNCLFLLQYLKYVVTSVYTVEFAELSAVYACKPLKSLGVRTLVLQEKGFVVEVHGIGFLDEGAAIRLSFGNLLI